MKPSKGIYQDVSPINQPEGTVLYSKNSIKYKKINSWTNELGFKVSAISIPYQPNGTIPLDNKAIIFSTDNINSAIGIYDEVVDTYTPILNRTDLGFTKDKPITGRAKRNYKGDIICVFTDKTRSAKYINLSTATNTQDIKDLLLFPISKVPIITVLSVDETGGNLPASVIAIAIQYKTNDGSRTNFSELSQPVYITDKDISVGTNNYNGVESGTLTTKQVNFELSNLDTSYDILSIALVTKINGITTSKLLPDINILGANSKTITVTGSETTTDIGLSQVLAGNASYNTVGCFAQLNNILYSANLGSTDLIKFQKIVNNIVVNYTTKITTPDSLVDTVVGANTTKYASQRLNSTPRGFLHGEVYALYASLILNSQARTPAFIIPGRAALPNDKLPSSLATIEGISPIPKIYQVEDTSVFISQDSIAAIGKGLMGYWENQSEQYPNDDNFDGTVDYNGNPIIGGRDLRTKNVLHHRFPTIETCKNKHYGANNEYGKTELDILGIELSNINVPLDLRDKIQGIEIFYAKRDNENSTIVGQSIIQFNAFYRDGVDDPNKSWSTGGNWNVDDNDAASSGTTDQVHLNQQYMRFYAFDMLQYKPAVSPSYITPQLKLFAGNVPSYFVADPSKNWWGYGINYLDPATGVRAVTDIEKIRKVTNFTYVPVNTIHAPIYNVHTEECMHMKLSNGFADLFVPTLVTNVGSGYANTLTDEQTYLTNLNQLKTDIYNDFIGQTLVSTGSIQLDLNSTTIENIYGGDTFVSVYSYLTFGPRNSTDNFSNSYNRFSHRFICESVSNIGLRYESVTDVLSKYWVKTDLTVLLSDSSLDSDKQNNRFAYNKDYSSVNDLVPTTPNNVLLDKTDKFPFRIIRSNPANTEEKDNVAWRSFLVDNNFESVQNKGEIINLEAKGNDQLIIHHRDSLFVTRPTNKLQLDLVQVVLGSGDIFSIKPEEPMPSVHGYLGTQHQLACLMTKYGYFSIDAEVGNVFLYGEQATDLSAGLRMFLIANLNILPIGLNIDNPFGGNGISVAYDETYERIIVGVKNVDTPDRSFTISYDIESRSWVSFHDYIPDFIFNTRNGLFSYKTQNSVSNLFIHNKGIRGIYYNAVDLVPVPFSSYIDIVFKAPITDRQVTLILQSINWITEVFDINGVPLFEETFDFITVRTNYQNSGKIALTKQVLITGEHNNRNVEGTWNFNDFRDIVLDRSLPNINDNNIDGYSIINTNIDANIAWFNKRKFEDKFFIVRLEYSNKSGNLLYLHEANALSRPSYR